MSSPGSCQDGPVAAGDKGCGARAQSFRLGSLHAPSPQLKLGQMHVIAETGWSLKGFLDRRRQSALLSQTAPPILVVYNIVTQWLPRCLRL